MQPRANFELIQAPDPEIFAIKISGHLTPRQKGVVEQLLTKCRETGKNKVLFDFTDLESLGGGVAHMLGDFAAELGKEGNPPYFVGARGIVVKFLNARFSEGEPSLASTIEEAMLAMGGGAAAAAAKKPAAKKAAPKKKAAAKKKATTKNSDPDPSKDEGEDFLEIVDAVNETASQESAETPPAPPRPAGVKAGSGGYISLDEALVESAKNRNSRGCLPDPRPAAPQREPRVPFLPVPS